MRVHLNGALVAAEAARIDPADRGFTLGDGLYETMAVRGGRVCRFDAHMARLGDGAEILGLPIPVSHGDLAASMAQTLEANGIADGVLRLTVTRGPAPRGLAPPADPATTVLITAHATAAACQPVGAILATRARRNEHSALARCKRLGDLDAIVARAEAERRGMGEALLLNTAGRIAEATIANLFVVLDGALVTPPLTDGALPGVMRAAVIDTVGADERALVPDDLARASEAFLTNSLGVRALVAVDGRPIGDGAPGPLTARAGAGLN